MWFSFFSPLTHHFGQSCWRKKEGVDANETNRSFVRVVRRHSFTDLTSGTADSAHSTGQLDPGDPSFWLLYSSWFRNVGSIHVNPDPDGPFSSRSRVSDVVDPSPEWRVSAPSRWKTPYSCVRVNWTLQTLEDRGTFYPSLWGEGESKCWLTRSPTNTRGLLAGSSDVG